MKKLRFFLLPGLVVLLSGCKMAILQRKGQIAASEMHLLVGATILMLLVVIPVIILSFVIPWRYRANNTKAKYTPEWADSVLLEIVWWSIPCAIIIVLATATWIMTHRLDPYRPLASKEKPITIQAIALDWKWLFIYPNKHFATINYVQIPVDVPVRFYITSDAPMNSLEIPQLAGQIYAMTGMRTTLYLNANTPGTYRGLSTNFSGNGFASMTFTVKATSRRQFDEWVKMTQQAPKKLTMAAYTNLVKPSENNPVEYFSSPTKNLFNIVLMKYMGADMPAMKNN